MKNIVLVHCIRYEDLPRYCFNCGERMTFIKTDENCNCWWICPKCHCTVID